MKKFEVLMFFETSESFDTDSTMRVCVYASNWNDALIEAKNLVKFGCVSLIFHNPYAWAATEVMRSQS